MNCITKNIGLVLVIFILSTSAFTQVQISGNLTTYIDNFINNMPSGYGTNEYQQPGTSDLTRWGTIVTLILQGQYSKAHDTAGLIGYRLLQYTDTGTNPNRLYYILEKSPSSSNHWGLFIYNPDPARPKLFIQSPHPKYDLNTGRQGFYVFKQNQVLAFFITGTHRCNSSFYSSCTGTTTVCSGSNESYRLSDQPHSISTLQKTTEILKNNISGLVVIQNHGFSPESGDPDVIISNGTLYYPTGTDYALQIKNNFYSTDTTLTFKVAHIDNWTRLIARENVQGRLINGSLNPCSQYAYSSSGRFVHIEQVYTKLRDNQQNWNKLSKAIALTFPISINVTSPNGGEILNSGANQTITWTSSGGFPNVKLEYTINNGKNWLSITPSTPNNGSYQWTIPQVGSWQCKIRITATSDTTVRDESNNVFAIEHSVWPISGSTTMDLIASPFGPRLLSGIYDFHYGIDLPNLLNTPIHPVKPGIVVRYEDTSQTIGTPRERFGNWILIQHSSIRGVPIHTAYLHLNAFNGYSIGDTVSTLDTIGYMGKSGVGINTIHLHLDYYKNLNGINIDKNKAQNPLEILNYNNQNNYYLDISKQNDSTISKVYVPSTELDFDKIIIYGRLNTKTISFNSRLGIDPNNNDNPRYSGVFIDPFPFTKDSTIMRYNFWTNIDEVGEVDSIRIEDIKGYSIVYSSDTARFAVISGNWNDDIWAYTASGTPGSAPKPKSTDNVTINSNIVVSISSPNAECKSISFANDNSKVSFLSGGVLNIYGNFTLASPTHNAFSSWADGAKIRFTGPNKQILSGWNTSTTTMSTTFMEMIVDKSADTVKTAGNDMKFNLGKSLEILNGSFVLTNTDDIQGRNLDGSEATTPTIIVHPNGRFIMYGGASHIGSGTTGTPRPPIGKVTVYGAMTLTTTSTNKINFNGLDIESGGIITLGSGWSTTAYPFNPGTITIKDGGQLINTVNTNMWHSGTTVDLKKGGTYKLTSSAPTFPPILINNGTVWYARNVSSSPIDQALIDSNYYRLEISFANSGAKKNWVLTENRFIQDSLETNNSAELVLSAASPKTLTLNGTLRLTSGILNNSNPNVTFALADNVTISRATGIITNAPLFGSSVNLRYTSTVSDVATGPEVPTAQSIIKDVQIYTGDKTVTLNSNITVNGNLILSTGIFDNSNYNLSLANTATIRRATAQLTAPPVFGSTINLEYISTVSDVITGFEVPANPNILNNLTLTTTKIVTLGSDMVVNGTITFTNNKLNTGAFKITSRGAIVGAGNGKFIEGNLSIPVLSAGLKKWEIGQNVDYLPLLIDFSSITGSDNITASVRDITIDPPAGPMTPENKVLRRYYRTEKGPGISSFSINSITLSYTDSDVTGAGADENNLKVFYYDGTGWRPLNVVSRDNTQNTITATGLNYFSDIVIAGEDMETLITKGISLVSGWNLVSVPLVADNMMKESLFPNAISAAFAFDNGYVRKDTLQVGTGYWLKYGTATTEEISGRRVAVNTIPVKAGWNLIGIYEKDVLASEITTTPLNIITSYFYEYSSGYIRSDILRSGKGYWIKVNQNGWINLPDLKGNIQTKKKIKTNYIDKNQK